MEKELPQNWIECKLDDIAIVQSGGTPSRGNSNYWNGEIPWVKISDIKDFYVTETSEFISEKGLKNSSARIFPKGTILFTIFATIGRVGVLKIEASTNQAIAGITPSTKINLNYLTYSLIKLSNEILGLGKGVAQKNINQTILKNTVIPLPPRPEQDRIVAKLDNLFGQLDTIKENLEKIPVLLKNFRQQVLIQAVTGKLTEEWRKGKKLESKVITLKDVCLSITDGDHQAPPRTENGIPFLVISNVSKGYFDFAGVTRFVPRTYYEALKNSRVPEKGDILYTVTGSFGIPLLVDINKEFCFQRHIAILRPDRNQIRSKYLLILLQSRLARKQAESVATGTAQMTVPLRGLRNFEFEIHNIEEQQEIINRVGSLFAKADKIQEKYDLLKCRIEQLPQAILHKAFNGELVPQLESDGDARELLREIEETTGNLIQRASNRRKKMKEINAGLRKYSENEEEFNSAAESTSNYTQ